MVFEVRGKQDVLGRISLPVYYTGDKEFTTGDIHCYLPGLYDSGALVPQDLTVMLEASVHYSEDLDPYIIWYNEDRRIGEGYVADGASQFLWKAPLQTGFHTIRAEVFPVKPRAGLNLKGRMRELLLPVSPKNEEAPPAALRSALQSDPPQGKNILHRYRFAGDLREAQGGAGLKRKKTDGAETAEDNPLLWYPAEQIYGLALRRGDTYESSRSVITLSKDHEGELRFLIRFLPLEEGVILNAVLGKDSNAVALTLSLTEGSLALNLEGQEGESGVTAALQPTGSLAAFITAEITVNIHKDRITAQLGLGDAPVETTEENLPPDSAELPLTEPVGGELISLLGDNHPAETAAAAPTVVLDDFAVIFQLPE
jgi:hypothetical protein